MGTQLLSYIINHDEMFGFSFHSEYNMSFLEKMFNVVRPAAKVKSSLPEFNSKPIHQGDATHVSSFPPYALPDRPQ